MHTYPELSGQGCIAVRGGGFCVMQGLIPGQEVQEPGDWQVSVSYRGLHSFRHFVGDVEQTQRESQGTPVENLSNFIDLGVGYNFTPRFSYALLPHWGLSASLGARIDGVPAEDAIGDSEGFRRPGYAVSIEPGLTWMKGPWTAVLTTPVTAEPFPLPGVVVQGRNRRRVDRHLP